MGVVHFLMKLYCIPLYIAYYREKEDVRHRIDLDLTRYDYGSLGVTAFNDKNFRNVFCYRISKQKILKKHLQNYVEAKSWN